MSSLGLMDIFDSVSYDKGTNLTVLEVVPVSIFFTLSVLGSSFSLLFVNWFLLVGSVAIGTLGAFRVFV